MSDWDEFFAMPDEPEALSWARAVWALVLGLVTVVGVTYGFFKALGVIS